VLLGLFIYFYNNIQFMTCIIRKLIIFDSYFLTDKTLLVLHEYFLLQNEGMGQLTLQILKVRQINSKQGF